MEDELATIRDADDRAQAYLAGIGDRPVYPPQSAIDALALLDEGLPDRGLGATSTIALMDRVGSAAVVESNGARYFGFVTGATLPVAAAADRLALSWDNSASTEMGSPGTAAFERVAGQWVLDALDLDARGLVGVVIVVIEERLEVGVFAGDAAEILPGAARDALDLGLEIELEYVWTKLIAHNVFLSGERVSMTVVG